MTRTQGSTQGAAMERRASPARPPRIQTGETRSPLTLNVQLGSLLGRIRECYLFHGRRMIRRNLVITGRLHCSRFPLRQFLAIEVTNNAGNVSLSFVIRRDAVVLFHALRSALYAARALIKSKLYRSSNSR